MFEVFQSGPLDNNVILLFCAKSKEAVVVDPALRSFEPISLYIGKLHLKLKRILLTHSHWDHIGDLSHFKGKYTDASICVHECDFPNVERPGLDGLVKIPGAKGISVDVKWQGGEVFSVGTFDVEVIYTPGHTPGSVCYYVEKERLLLSGDTLFRGSYGRISFPRSDSEKMWDFLKRLYSLPFDTHVIPGHGEQTTIGEENWMPNAKHLFK